ncbi:MAG: hypothetical protein CVV41_06335 [Candidatus Riflebacteria bacterium HGW-Riflebacteria-1]|nr:MAG: hypothetical protein CVV41_06335 [Candidatus Riflebacteria bacterium HGW-Riflebacteria-1]
MLRALRTFSAPIIFALHETNRAASEGNLMFDKIRLIDWDTIVYSVIILVPAVLFTLPLLVLSFHTFKEYQAGKAIFRGLHPGDYVTIVVGGLLYLLMLLGIRWSWKSPAFVCVENSGEWVCRNSYGYSLLRIPPHMPRRIESTCSKSFDDAGVEFEYSVRMQIQTESAPPVAMTFMSQPLENGEPDFYQKVGYPANLVLLPGANDSKLTPWHGWNTYGYVYLLDKNIAEAQTNSNPSGE